TVNSSLPSQTYAYTVPQYFGGPASSSSRSSSSQAAGTHTYANFGLDGGYTIDVPVDWTAKEKTTEDIGSSSIQGTTIAAADGNTSVFVALPHGSCPAFPTYFKLLPSVAIDGRSFQRATYSDSAMGSVGEHTYYAGEDSV